jgi:2-amino-4-hydroxy-6-hydroxymethyldihydropteridine diphosphokinase
VTGAAGEPLVIGLGGNIGGEAAIVERFRRARDALAELGELRSAPLYRSAPVGPVQPPFLNTAVRLRIAELLPAELIAAVLEIERLLGRDRRGEERWGPRPIDLDVLVWGARVVRSPELEVPHPRLAERRFALAPLVALLGEAFEVPGHGPAGALLARVGTQAVEEIAASW